MKDSHKHTPAYIALTIASIRVGKKYIIPKASVEKFITEGIQK